MTVTDLDAQANQEAKEAVITSIKDCALSVRAINALTAAGYKTLEQCLFLNEQRLLNIRNIGCKTAEEIHDLLDTHKERQQSAAEHELANFEESDPAIILLAMPVNALVLSVRTQNVFEKMQIHCLYDLVKRGPYELLRQRNCGKTTLSQIETGLAGIDLKLGTKYSQETVRKIERYRLAKKDNYSSLYDDLQQKAPELLNKLNASRAISIDTSLTTAKVNFYRRCFQEYQRHGTLEKVGRILGLTRERIRQVLVKGSRLGLFEYKPREYVIILKGKILEGYRKRPSLVAVARANNISTGYAQKLCTLHGITAEILREIATEARREKCIEQYQQIQHQLNHHPTTTELQRVTQWRSLWARITRHWGSFDAFREQLSIPKPSLGNPAFREVTRKWMENRRRLALIIKMERLDAIRECFSEQIPLTCSEISDKCGLKYQTTANLLKLLMATGEVKREGAGNAVKYRLWRRGGLK